MRISQAQTVVIGSGCAGLNAADWLLDLGLPGVMLVTESMNAGTSRNAGSDKQTYYKLSLSGAIGDSPEAMARDMMSEGVNADNALAEASSSVQSFFKLVSLGVPFPCNNYGEYVGYQTDHDPRSRATSAGPLTSRLMTEALEASALRKGLRVLDNTLAFKILANEGCAAGVLCLETTTNELHMIRCAHIILAVGGPAYIYSSSVYPLGHTGMTGMALSAGAACSNLHQWQYGLSSTDFRWNVSGSYQQALPRYVSIDEAGVDREFLLDDLTPREALRLTFLKGYQWPFDTRKAKGSSLIDLLTHRQTHELGRNVYLDFTRNPTGWTDDLSALDNESRTYLENSGAVQRTPVKRLERMNQPAIELYRAHGINLYTTPLRIEVCAQHCNGGVSVDSHWQTTMRGLYAAGEAAGTFGAYRPGGSALNSTQAGSMRAAQHIALNRRREPLSAVANSLINAVSIPLYPHAEGILVQLQSRMSAVGAHLRDIDGLRALREDAKTLRRSAKYYDVNDRELTTRSDLAAQIKLNDMLITLDAVIDAMLFAADFYGSTGAGLVADKRGGYLPHRDEQPNCVIETKRADAGEPGEIRFASRAVPVREFPRRDLWFESVWKTFRREHGI
ncbi:MAG: FAD-binding protein [Oscillospiraceae bacterium]|jgi:succinate dehydrogenase/fumarate reductase flavoprotein subunit|nr:FAD-binding protein [Oscillospiraceae bacterium]